MTRSPALDAATATATITVTVIEVSFLESEIVDGAYGETDTVTTLHYLDSVEEAAEFIQSLGLDFASTGNTWAADPDGSFIVDYATGQRIERTAHLEDAISDDDLEAIMELVG